MCHINLGVCSFTPPFICHVYQQIQRTSFKIVGVDFETSSFPHWAVVCSVLPSRNCRIFVLTGPCETYQKYTWSDNIVCELIAVKVLHTSLLNTTVVAFKVLLLGSYAPMPAPSTHFKTIWKWFCGKAFRAAVVLLRMTSMSSKSLHFNISFIFRNRKKSLGARSGKLALTSL